jgi:hypothetical protein
VASLSQVFTETAQRQFGFLSTEFGFDGPTIRQSGWQWTTVYYLKGSIAVAVTLDVEEQVFVTIELWDGVAKAEYPKDDRRRFSPTSLARFRDARWTGVASEGTVTEADLDGILSSEAAALRAHAKDVLAGQTDGLQAFLASSRK